MQKFELVLRNEKQKLYGRLTVFILLLNALAIVWSLISFRHSTTENIFGVSGLILLVLVLSVYRYSRARAAQDYLFAITAFLIAVYWPMNGNWWMGVGVTCLFCLYFINKRKLIVRFFPDKIEYPSFPKRIIQWSELNNVIVKDDWLTIDFKNNRIIQEITEGFSPAGNEQEFNDFCRQSLRS